MCWELEYDPASAYERQGDHVSEIDWKEVKSGQAKRFAEELLSPEYMPTKFMVQTLAKEHLALLEKCERMMSVVDMARNLVSKYNQLHPDHAPAIGVLFLEIALKQLDSEAKT
jgi:hypothetical protein